MSAAEKKGGSDRKALKRGLAGGVRREVRPDERVMLAGLKPDAQTQAVLDSLPESVARSDRQVVATTGGDGDTRRGGTPAVEQPAEHPSTRAAEESGQGRGRVIELVAVDQIVPSPHQTRRFFSGVEELAASILTTGLQHPVLLRRARNGAAARYALVFGERRHRAFQQLNRHADAEVRARHETIPAFVLEPDELSDARLAVLTAEENAQRAGLTAWELAQNVVNLKAALDSDAGRPVRFDQLARHFQLQAGSTNEYYTIGAALPEAVLRQAGLVQGDDVDWQRVSQLKKQRLLSIARKPEPDRVALLRTYAGVDGPLRRRGSGPRYSVEQLRADGGFALKIEKPVSSASYNRTQSESFLRDLEPALALLAEIASDGRAVYAPDAPNLPGTYLVLRDRVEKLSPDERRQALEVVEALRRKLAAP